jgi:hypothetical protein
MAYEVRVAEVYFCCGHLKLGGQLGNIAFLCCQKKILMKSQSNRGSSHSHDFILPIIKA